MSCLLSRTQESCAPECGHRTAGYNPPSNVIDTATALNAMLRHGEGSHFGTRALDLRRRGGQLYVWGSSVGGKSGSALLRTSTKRGPVGVQFERLELDGLTLWFDAGLTIDKVELGFSPFAGGIDITWPEVIPTSGGG